MSDLQKKLYFYVEEESNFWCVSNTMLVLMYTFMSFASICFIIMARQIIYSKKNIPRYMHAISKPDDSDAEADAAEEEISALKAEDDKSQITNDTTEEPKVVEQAAGKTNKKRNKKNKKAPTEVV